MPFEIKRCTLPHLKGLNSVLEPSTRPGRGSTFTLHYILWKVTIFLHKQAMKQFHINIAVHHLLHENAKRTILIFTWSLVSCFSTKEKFSHFYHPWLLKVWCFKLTWPSRFLDIFRPIFSCSCAQFCPISSSLSSNFFFSKKKFGTARKMMYFQLLKITIWWNGIGQNWA